MVNDSEIDFDLVLQVARNLATFACRCYKTPFTDEIESDAVYVALQVVRKVKAQNSAKDLTMLLKNSIFRVTKRTIAQNHRRKKHFDSEVDPVTILSTNTPDIIIDSVDLVTLNRLIEGLPCLPETKKKFQNKYLKS